MDFPSYSLFIAELKREEFFSKIKNYFSIDSRKRKREKERGEDRIEKERELLEETLKNKIPTTHVTEFLDFISLLAERGYIVSEYRDNKTPLLLVCKNLHQYRSTKVHLDRRIKEDKDPCGECGGDCRCDNEYLRKRKESKKFKDSLPYSLDSWNISPEDTEKIKRMRPEKYNKTLDYITDRLQLFPSCKSFVSSPDKTYTKNIPVSLQAKGESWIVISNTSGIRFLNYFVLDQILKTRRGGETIYSVWSDRDKRRKLIDDTFRNPDLKSFSPMSVLSKFSYRGARAYNFPPNIAKYVYDTFGGKRVLDFCAGFLGRLLGFWHSSAEEYLCIDPNKNIPFSEVLDWLKRNDSCSKKASITYSPAEDLDFSRFGTFDLVFTSPPYFDLEIYSDDENQSTSRYKSYNDWLNRFLFPVLEKSISILNPGGYLAINIKNIKKFPIADDMNEFLSSKDDIERKDDIVFSRSSKNKKRRETIYLYRKITYYLKD